MPFFFIEEILHDFLFSKFVSMYYRYRHNRGDNTLFMHIIKTLTAKINGFYNGIYNTFSYRRQDLDVERGTLDGERRNCTYYLMTKKIYAKRFSTDCYSEVFAEKALTSKIGFDDLEEYKTDCATFEELKKQNSYFVKGLLQSENKFDEDDAA
jgi:hypothetical protein